VVSSKVIYSTSRSVSNRIVQRIWPSGASPLVLAIKRAFALTSNLDFTKIEPEFYDLRRRSRLPFQQAKRLAPHFILPGRGRLS
jgi:hypothetical protein